MEEAEMRKIAEDRKREKMAEKMARQKIKEEIEKDKAERAAKVWGFFFFCMINCHENKAYIYNAGFHTHA
jgi:hypothetical protein